MSKISPAKYCQKNKERLQKNLLKGIKIFLKKRSKSKNIATNNVKIFLSMTNRSWLNIKKIIKYGQI